MNNPEAGLIKVTSSLTNVGALCRPYGMSIIVATWKTTVWRIFVDGSFTSNRRPAGNEEIERLCKVALENNQQAVIARLCPEGHVEYRNAENGKTIRPRCLIKGKRVGVIKKREVYGQG